MTTAKRTLIRQAMATALTGLATCGSRVHASRGVRLTKDTVPATLVSTGGETFGPEMLNTGKPVLRQMNLYVDIVVVLDDGYEDLVDAAEAEIEAAIFATVSSSTLGGLIHGMTLTSIGDPDLDDSADPALIRLPLVFQALYA